MQSLSNFCQPFLEKPIVNANLTNVTNNGARHAVAPSSLAGKGAWAKSAVWAEVTGMQPRSYSTGTQSRGFFGTEHIGTGIDKTASGGLRTSCRK
jgi:hypothetical protein